MVESLRSLLAFARRESGGAPRSASRRFGNREGRGIETSAEKASFRVRRGFVVWEGEGMRELKVESAPTPEESASRLPTPGIPEGR